MSIFENRLAMACKQVGECSAELLEWIDDNEKAVTSERISLLREFYRAGTVSQRLASAVNAMSCVAVVGPRRSGKTQLVSSLIERGNGALALRFDGIQEAIGFTRQVAPEGGRFASGCVIRLSAKVKPTPQNFPVAARLMTFADLVKSLGSAYLSAAVDRRAQVPGVVRVRTMLQETLPRLSPTPIAGLREDDIWEIRDYFSVRYVDEPLLRVLSAAGYWEFLAEHAGALAPADRNRLLGLIWGELSQFTLIFAGLSDALARLGYGREAACALDAILGLDQRTGKLQRRTDSILAGQTIVSLSDAVDETVVVRTELGQWVSLSRPILAALVTEVRLPVRGYASELLEKADLVEMPSIEQREPVPDLGEALRADGSLAGQLLLKAKAVLLHERYVADNEITAMVVCIDPTSRKLGELPRLVADWVERSHGADASEREPNDCGLFLALTKLDREIGEPVRRGKDRRVDIGARLATMLREELGRGHGWPHEWTTGRPFDAVHLIRSPAAKAKQLFDYDTAGRETGVRPAMLERLERARTDFLSSDIAKSHVADPQSVWNEAMELNDGGVTYLAQSIEAVCDMRVKHRQILSALTALRQSMKDRLQRYYVSDNYALQQARRHGAAMLVVRRIRNSAEMRRLGPLIHALQTSDAELADVLGKLASLRAHHKIDRSAAADEARAFAQTAVAHWIDGMRTVAGAGESSRQFMLPRNVLLNLVDEMIVGAGRLDLVGLIARRIEAETAAENDIERKVTVASLCAASLIGEYVMWLGANDQRSNSRLRRKGKAETPIFPPRKSVDLGNMDARDTPGGDRFDADWCAAFIALVAENTSELRERDLSAEQNRRLGQLLMQLDAAI